MEKFNLVWQDLFFVFCLVVGSVINFTSISQYKQLPSPIYGGDYYHHLGIMYNIKNGGNLFEHSVLVGEQPWVPPLYPWLVVTFSSLTNASLIKAGGIFTVIIFISGVVIAYFFGNFLFGDKTFALILALVIGIFVTGTYYAKYLDFSIYVTMPLFFMSFLNYLKKKDITSSILAGIMLGIVGLSHMQAFIAAWIFVIVFFLWFYFFRSIDLKERRINVKNVKNTLLQDWKSLLIIILVGFSLSLPFWFKPIFIFYGSSLNKLSYYGWADVSRFDIQILTATQGIINNFLNFPALLSGNLFQFIYSILISLGIFFLFSKKETSIEEEFLRMAMVALLIGMFHYFITIPLLNTHFGQDRLVMMNFSILAAYFCCGFKYVKQLFSDKFKILLILIFILFLLGYLNTLSVREGDQWVKVGKTETTKYFLDTANWINANTNLNDVFLTTNEDGFLVNSLSGRKTLNYRRTHVGPFVDMNRRELDAAIILYGDDKQKTYELLEKYNVKYLFWNYRWIQNEFNIDENGRIIGYFDPLMMEYSLERENELKRYGVNHTKDKTWMDPAWQSTYPKVDVLIALPNWNFTQPWSNELSKHLRLVKEFEQDSYILAKIYEIDYLSFEQ